MKTIAEQIAKQKDESILFVIRKGYPNAIAFEFTQAWKPISGWHKIAGAITSINDLRLLHGKGVTSVAVAVRVISIAGTPGQETIYASHYPDYKLSEFLPETNRYPRGKRTRAAK